MSAAVDTSFTPSANGDVYALAASGANVYVGGPFSQVNGVTRNGLALLDGTTGTVLPFNPNPNERIRYTFDSS